MAKPTAEGEVSKALPWLQGTQNPAGSRLHTFHRALLPQPSRNTERPWPVGEVAREGTRCQDIL